MEQHSRDEGRCGLDDEISRVLGLASDPHLPDGATQRLLARLQAEPQGGPSVIPFRPRPRRMGDVLRYASALPLAASLALGIWLGAKGTLDPLLPAPLIGDMASNGYDESVDELGGVGEADAYAEEQQT